MTGQSTRTIEIFRPGTFAPMEGGSLAFSAEDLATIAAAYDGVAAPAPVVIGHPSADAPAFAWVSGLRFDAGKQRLLADLEKIEPAFEAAVADGRYRRVSASFFGGDAPANPKPGRWYLRHVGFLGAAAPAVPGLAPVNFSAPATATVEFGEPALRDVAALFRSLRDFLIAQFGLETADKALTDWRIGWIDDAAERPVEPAFAAPTIPPTPTTETSMPDPKPGATPEELANRLADLDRRERDLAHRDAASFAEGLVRDGRLVPAVKDKVIALLTAVAVPAAVPATVSFADGSATKAVAPAELLREILGATPKVVEYGRTDLGRDPSAGAASFAAPAGFEVDRAGAELHARATAYIAAHPDTAYLDAVRAVQAAR